MAEIPRIFIASSAEALPVAEAVHIRLDAEARVKLWDNAFDLSSLTLPSLLARTAEADFAVFVFHRDDKVIIRGNEFSAVRDNVVFELGLFIGALGLDHCFVLLPRTKQPDFRLPTDLAGLTVAAYDDTADEVVDAVTASCAKIKQVVKKVQAARGSSSATVQPTVDPLRNAQTELWRARIELQRASEQLARAQSAIATHFFSIAKPATEAEIKAWEEGATNSYSNVPKLHLHNTFFVDRDVVLPAFHGAHAISVIVAPGVKLYGLDEASHNEIYLMDGFRKLGP